MTNYKPENFRPQAAFYRLAGSVFAARWQPRRGAIRDSARIRPPPLERLAI